MAEASGRRRRGEWVMLAQVVAAGVSAGMSGKWDPIDALAEQLDVPLRASRRAGSKPVRDLVGRLYAEIGGAKYAGGHSRATGG